MIHSSNRLSMFSHLDEDGKVRMVNVSEKNATPRMARARTTVHPGPKVLAAVREGDIHTAKGPVFQTAIIAGVMGAKRTSELIPLCHPVGMNDCQIAIDIMGEEIVIECTARVHARTGVEMEALTGATVAALTLYDMCKSISQDIIIGETKLMEKRGGKRDFLRESLR